MSSRDRTSDDFKGSISTGSDPPRKRVDYQRILEDLRAGLRTRHFLSTYGLTLQEFEAILKDLIRKRLFSKEEFRAWKAHTPASRTTEAGSSGPPPALGQPHGAGDRTVTTYVIPEPEKNNSWALQLFSTRRDLMAGANFKVVLHGKKYSFVVEKLLFRGPVRMLESKAPKAHSKEKREQAMEFIAKYGWAAYLENRAYAANFDKDGMRESGKARLVLLHCRNGTFVAALHTPAPAINLYVGGSLQTIRERLSNNVDISDLAF
jgi:hypothetical protein